MATKKKCESWDKRYKKWDNYDENDESEEEIVKKPTVFDHSGDERVVIKDISYISSSENSVLKKLEKRDNEVWQVIVRKLRVWTASSEGASEGKDAIPCRPYCILFNNLYPLGQVIHKSICSPPEKYPSCEFIFKTTVELMLKPPNSEPQHRPGKLVFPDHNFVGEFRKSYASIGIECTYLSESEGIDEFIKDFSEILVKRDMGAIGTSSEKPGLLSVKGVVPEILQSLFHAAADFYRAAPWKYLKEQQGIVLHGDHLYVNSTTSLSKGSIYATVLGHQDSICGIAVFCNRLDMERRLKPKESTLAYLEIPQMRHCAMCDKDSNEVGNDLKRCTRCQIVFYCNANCQRSHWPTHKSSCTSPESTKKEFWATKELSLLYEDRTSFPFDDLDAIDRYNLEVIDSTQNVNCYPLVISFLQGVSSRPEAIDLVWMERVLRAFVKMMDVAPLYMEKSISRCLGEKYPSLQLEINTMDCKNPETVHVSNATVLTVENVKQVKAHLESTKLTGQGKNEEDSKSHVVQPSGESEVSNSHLESMKHSGDKDDCNSHLKSMNHQLEESEGIKKIDQKDRKENAGCWVM